MAGKKLSQQNPRSKHLDIAFESHGSIVLIRAVSDAGQTWLDENVGNDETQYFGGAIAAHPRYCPQIFQGAVAAGIVGARMMAIAQYLRAQLQFRHASNPVFLALLETLTDEELIDADRQHHEQRVAAIKARQAVLR